ncbi:hypothetical protein FQN60_016299 [Etheostoma spectabile]|uniref:Uncharacterized protein n=1 Tax=Etheostoma spectabile TaxID=54343 RepID=A0A5J5D0J6_9PERO|nr:hypothetical protein FQN60_016299 [Etheostoma spectabile]
MSGTGSKTKMVREELAVRLNDKEYKNWLKAGRCLLILKDAFLNMQGVFRVADSDPKTPQTARCHSELGQLFPSQLENRPLGTGQVKGADQCDASALLNLINYCDCFRSVDPKFVREVIRYRNELMHSYEFRVKDEWMSHYQATVKEVVRQFSHVPQMAKVGQQVEEMLSVDLSICVSGLDRMDSANMDGIECDSVSQWEASADLISQWEAELLQESLQGLLHAAADDTKTPDTKQLKKLGSFLQTNRDLGERFSEELRAINSLEARE